DGEAQEALAPVDEGAARAAPGAWGVGLGEGDVDQVVNGHRDDESGWGGRGDRGVGDEGDVSTLVPPAACLEQGARGGVVRGELGDEGRRAEDRQLGAERREEVAAVTLADVVGVDGDAVDERMR